MADFDSPFDALSLLSEVLRGDEEMLSLDIGNLVKRYPDVTHEQLVCLLLLRGDLGRNHARDAAAEFVSPEQGERVRDTLHAKSILSQVTEQVRVDMNEPNQQRALGTLPTELRCGNFVIKHRLDMYRRVCHFGALYIYIYTSLNVTALLGKILQ